MRANFDAALAAVLVHEGGFVNDPHDPGGATNRGVTQETYDLWRIDHQLPKRSVKHITAAEVMAIYKRRYWDAVSGDQLASGLDYCLFDFAVNSGPRRAATYLQRVLGVADDGKIGPQTLDASEAVPAKDLIEAICNLRLAFMKKQPTWPRFGKGWGRRVQDVRNKSREMCA
jgi:lysozyme family protein